MPLKLSDQRPLLTSIQREIVEDGRMTARDMFASVCEYRGIRDLSVALDMRYVDDLLAAERRRTQVPVVAAQPPHRPTYESYPESLKTKLVFGLIALGIVFVCGVEFARLWTATPRV